MPPSLDSQLEDEPESQARLVININAPHLEQRNYHPSSDFTREKSLSLTMHLAYFATVEEVKLLARLNEA